MSSLLSSPVEQLQVLSSAVLRESSLGLEHNQKNFSPLNSHAAALQLSQVRFILILPINNEMVKKVARVAAAAQRPRSCFQHTITTILVSFNFCAPDLKAHLAKYESPNRSIPGLISRLTAPSCFATLKTDSQRGCRSHTPCPSSTVSSLTALTVSLKVTTTRFQNGQMVISSRF